MITKFKIFENNTIDVRITDIPEPVLNRIIDDLSIISWKGQKKNGNKNYKSIRIINIDGYYNKRTVQSNSSSTDILLKIMMSNKDYIEAKYELITNITNIVDNNISIYINNNKMFDLDIENNDENVFLSKIRDIYIKHLEKNGWKIK